MRVSREIVASLCFMWGELAEPALPICLRLLYASGASLRKSTSAARCREEVMCCVRDACIVFSLLSAWCFRIEGN